MTRLDGCGKKSAPKGELKGRVAVISNKNAKVAWSQNGLLVYV